MLRSRDEVQPLFMKTTAPTPEDYVGFERYSYQQVVEESVRSFGGDEMAAQVFAQKYALQDEMGRYLESTPQAMHVRLATELARISANRNIKTECCGGGCDSHDERWETLFKAEFDRFYDQIAHHDEHGTYKGFGAIVLQGSPMSAIGNPFKLQSASNCFAPGTMVFLSNRGPTPIEEVQVGDYTITHAGKVQRVEQVHKNVLGDRQVYSVKAFRSPEFRVTDNHKFMSLTKEQRDWGENPQWNDVDKLRVGDWIAVPNSDVERKQHNIKLDVFGEKYQRGDFEYIVLREGEKFKFATVRSDGRIQEHKSWIPREIPLDENFAYFLGLWYGDGCIFGKNKKSAFVGGTQRNSKPLSRKNMLSGITFTFGAHESKIIDFVCGYFDKLEINYSKNTSNADRDGTVQILVHSAAIGGAFEELFGRGFAGKALSNFIYSWDKQLVRSLLQGLVDSDGTITKSGDVRVVMSNKKIIREVFHLARARGFLVGYSENEKTARLDFGRAVEFIQDSNKTYHDNRIEKLAESGAGGFCHVIEVGGYKLVQIRKKTKVEVDHEHVYTLGVAEDHSYSVEGLISQNCFVIGQPFDSYSGIMHTDQQLAQLMKRRAGVGVDISTLRPKGLPTKNAAKTTDGIGVFMERFSNTCREVAQGGRRGAEMITIDCHHPEILTFINIKRDRSKVTGANISIRYTKEFHDALENNGEYELRFPVEPGLPEDQYLVKKKISAKEVWDAAMEAAWESAEPGALFWDVVREDSPSDIYSEEGFASISTNPCFSGDTLIAVADGRGAVSIKQLAEEGKDVPVYSTDPKTGEVSVRLGRGPRISGFHKTLLRVTTDKGFHVDVTPDHNMMLRDGTKIQAKDLERGMSLSSFVSIGDQVKEAGEAYNHKVESVEELQGEHTVYNITVDDFHTLAVVTNKEQKLNGNTFFGLDGVSTYNCGEIVLNANDSCRLTALNLKRFLKSPWTNVAEFDFVGLRDVALVAQEVMDLVVDLEVELVDRIIAKIVSDPEPESIKGVELGMWREIKRVALAGRRTGLGLTALGDAMAACGIKYGSEDSIQFAEAVARAIAVGSFVSSVRMAKVHGAFPIFKAEKEKGHPWTERMCEAAVEEGFEGDVADFWVHGRRNISLTTVAPTGSVSIMTQSSSGVEPVFMPYYTRRRKLSDTEIEQGVSVDFVDHLGDKWHEYPVFHHGLRDWLIVQGVSNPETLSVGEIQEWVQSSPYQGATAMDQQWEAGVRLQGAVQRWISHSISRTANIPNDAPVELVDAIYRAAWKARCKGYTVYRDGSRTGVLISNDESTVEDGIKHTDAPKRPEVLPMDVHHVRYKGEEWTVLVGMLNDKPFEVFAGPVEDLPVPECATNVEVVKHTRKTKGARYELRWENGEGSKNVRDIAKVLEAEHNTLTRLTSLSLRHGAKIQYVVEQLNRDESSFLSFSRVLARTLKGYIPEGASASKAAFSDCDTPDLCEPVYSEGCLTCKGCGKSKCG